MTQAQTPCQVCGASASYEEQLLWLVAVCDVLVLKALETLGKRIVRAERSRFQLMAGRPYFMAHVLWRAQDVEVDKALRGAWDVVGPLLRNRGGAEEVVEAVQVVSVLDSYVHDLAITGTPHSTDELLYRLRTRLGLPVHA